MLKAVIEDETINSIGINGKTACYRAFFPSYHRHSRQFFSKKSWFVSCMVCVHQYLSGVRYNVYFSRGSSFVTTAQYCGFFILLLEKFCNVMHQGSLAGSTQNKIPDTNHRDFKFVLLEEAFLIEAAAVSHDTAVNWRKRSSPEKEMFQFCMRFAGHGLNVMRLGCKLFQSMWRLIL